MAETVEERKARRAAEAADLKSRTRWYIQFTVKNLEPNIKYSVHDYRRYKSRAVWPKLFKSLEELKEFKSNINVFRNEETIPGVRGRLVSYTMEKVILPKQN